MIDNKSVFSDNRVCSLYGSGQFLRMFLGAVNRYPSRIFPPAFVKDLSHE